MITVAEALWQGKLKRGKWMRCLITEFISDITLPCFIQLNAPDMVEA